MILVISDSVDSSTNKVMAYLNNNSSVQRINRDEKEFKYPFEFDTIFITYSSIWLRRGNFFNLNPKNKFNNELNSLCRFLHFLARQHKNCLGSLIKEYDHNKLIDLAIAKSLGINVPASWFISNLNQLRMLLKKNKTITKFINDSIYDISGTQIVDKAIMSDFNKDQSMFPSLLQLNIQKVFEVRSFFIKGDFYSMAIFSQSDTNTKIDYRNNEAGNINREVPFKLPQKIENKLRLLMEKLELNTGSIDLIYSKGGEFVFLEVNPVGQFDWLSTACNYNIEKIICKYLLNEK